MESVLCLSVGGFISERLSSKYSLLLCFFFLNMNLHAFSLDLEAVSFKADVKTFNRRDKL